MIETKTAPIRLFERAERRQKFFDILLWPVVVAVVDVAVFVVAAVVVDVDVAVVVVVDVAVVVVDVVVVVVVNVVVVVVITIKWWWHRHYCHRCCRLCRPPLL